MEIVKKEKKKTTLALQIVSVKAHTRVSGREYEKSALGHVLFFQSIKLHSRLHRHFWSTIPLG